VLLRRGFTTLRIGIFELLLLVAILCYLGAAVFNSEPIIIFEVMERMILPSALFMLLIFLRAALRDKEHTGSMTRSQALTLNLFIMVACTAAAHAFVSLFQIMFLENYRLSAHIGNPNFYASFIGASFVFLLCTFTSKDQSISRNILRNKVIRGSLLALLVFLPILVIASRSRGGAVALFICVMIFFWFKKGFLKTVLFASVLGLALALIPNPLSDRISGLNGSTDQFSRTFIWKVELNNIIDHPFGLGPNMAKHHFGAKAAELAPLSELVFKNTRDPAHNMFLEAGLEGGVIAVAALVFAVIILVIRWIRVLKHRQDSLAVAAGFCLFLFFIHAQVDCLDRCYFIGVLAVVMLSLLLDSGGTRAAVNTRAEEHARSAKKRPATAACVLLVIVPAVLFLSAPVSEQLRLAAISKPEAVSSRQNTITSEGTEICLYWAACICPWNYNVFNDRFDIAADLLKKTGEMRFFASAMTAIIKALELNPLSSFMYKKLGLFYADLSPELAEKIPNRYAVISSAFEKAHRYDPFNVIGQYCSLLKMYYPNNTAAFIEGAAAFDGLGVDFAKLELFKGICNERRGEYETALNQYILSVKNYNMSLYYSKTLPEDSRLRNFHRFNINGFSPEAVKKKISALRRIIREKEKEKEKERSLSKKNEQ